MDTQTNPTPVRYETTCNKQPKAPKISRRKSTAPAGSIVRLALGTVVTVGAVYAINYALIVLLFGSIGAALGGGDVTGAGLLVLTALMLTGGILMLSTRWSRSGGIVAGIVLIVAAVVGLATEDSTDMAPYLAAVCCISGVISVVISAIFGGTGSRI